MKFSEISMKSRIDCLQEWRGKVNCPTKIYFISEAPPIRGYFWESNTPIKKKTLSYHLLQALGIDISNQENRKEALEEFVKRGFFLSDATYEVLKDRKNLRKQILKPENLDRIKEEIDSLKPLRIIVIGKGVHKILSKFLKNTNLEVVPFPSYQWVNQFNKEIKEKI